MNQRRVDLSTADLAAQQPIDTAPPDRASAADVERRDLTDDELRPEDLSAEERTRDTTVVEDGSRRPHRPAHRPLRRSPTAGRPAPRPAPARCWPPRMPRGSGPAGPISRPGSSTRPGGRSNRPTPWWPSSCSTWPGPSPMSEEGWRASGTAVTMSPPTTSATPSSATARSSNGSWPPNAFRTASRCLAGSPSCEINIWRGQAQHLANSLAKGDRVRYGHSNSKVAVQPGCSAAVCHSSLERAAAFRDRPCLLGPRGALVVYGLAAEWWPEAVAGSVSSDIP
jgi:hypothetical protein